jgi:threonine/homoserine/homoserine lactone efflux protein
LNPKAALFYLAFLPQFIDPDRGSIVTQTLLLGGIFSVMAVCNDVSYALLAGRLGAWLRVNAGFLRRQRYITGSVYVMLGLVTAMTGSRKS